MLQKNDRSVVRSGSAVRTARLLSVGTAIAVLLPSLSTSFSFGAPTQPHANPPAVIHKIEKAEAPKKVLPHVNPHLHLPLDAHKVIPTTRRHWRSHWHHVWVGYYDWVGFHRGLGIIQGDVHTTGGEPEPGIRVYLRAANGHGLHSVNARHITTTFEDGRFVMTGVRTGSYRVRADRGKANAHVSIRVGAGRISNASIKL